MKVFGIYCFGKLCMVWLFFGIGIFDNDCVGNGKEMWFSNRRCDMKW